MSVLITTSATRKKKTKKGKNMSEIKHEYQIKFHEPSCAETAGLGMCNCSPKIIPTEIDGSIKNGELTCGMCGHSFRGEIECEILEDTMGNSLERLWTKGDDRSFWIRDQESNVILCQDCVEDEFISEKECCDRTGFDLTTLYQMARSGEIPGAVWGETLSFKREEFKKWYVSEVEKVCRSLEEIGYLTSFVDLDGQRYYMLAERVQ
jgi:excisionase family DNA binding protein